MKKVLMITAMCFAFGTVAPVMAEGNVSAGKTKSAVCAACHGVDGNSPTAMFPKLAGQGEAYLVKQLMNFKTGERQNAVMAPMVASLTDEDMADLAAYYASKKVTPGAVSEDLLNAGKTLYQAGNRDNGVPACMACHGPTGAGVPAAKWPALSGQHPDYIEAQLKAFSEGVRNNDPNNMMRDIASKLSAAEMKAVAAYVSGLH
ncbi:MAG: cytochrome c4 [Gammaproteobacteria bacterium]|nr:cytochrome c4 [Gammaproteobacteria bacterium]